MSEQGEPDVVTLEVAAAEERSEYFTPAALLNSLERTCHRIFDGIQDDSFDAGEIDVMLCILIPELRKALRSAGLDIPAYGPYSARREELAAAERAAAAEAKDARETALYRWFDVADLLLYVGIADDLSDRTKSHVKGSTWMEFVARSTVERYPSRSAALAAETTAIKTEYPLFNKQHNDTPEARRRLVEYLIERDRLDLLAPAVSRG